ncbi:Asp-tRNA(Asn)/Glu-tRNA(Gln) amidotransferase subunit GatA [Eubacteriales bacterium OttesenSCG-928-M02]|nr:Asp-tRNA(Asn)/Glu-tRNA(Gln) amidotransferase subunit GatA [Eubacteriales bacterium OttesenSCG-928-M02]
MDSFTMPARELAQRIHSGEIGVVEAVQAAIDKAEANRLNAYITIDKEGALMRAEAVQKDIEGGRVASPLAGVPMAIKDNILQKGRMTSCASRMLGDEENPFIAPYDATVVEKLEAAGAIVLGHTNMDEFAMGSTSEYSYYGPVQNPWGENRIPGGSSGGSAALVADRAIPYALGTDTGGSIRQPAAFCGITGLKPTYGAVSRYGVVAHASSLDQVGPLAQTAADCRAILEILCGKDEMDGTSMALRMGADVPSFEGKRIGIPVNYLAGGIDGEVKAAVERAAKTMVDAGAELVELEMKTVDYAIPAYYIVSAAEASSNLSRYDGIKYGYRPKEYEDLYDLYLSARTEGFGEEVKRRIMLGSFVLSSGYYDAYYKKAMQVRALIKKEFDAALTRCDAILSPVTPSTAPVVEGREADPLKIRMMDIYTVSINLCGLPALSLPCGHDEGGLPIGMQLIGRAFHDGEILALGEAYQNSTDYHKRMPRKGEVA